MNLDEIFKFANSPVQDHEKGKVDYHLERTILYFGCKNKKCANYHLALEAQATIMTEYTYRGRNRENPKCAGCGEEMDHMKTK